MSTWNANIYSVVYKRFNGASIELAGVAPRRSAWPTLTRSMPPVLDTSPPPPHHWRVGWPVTTRPPALLLGHVDGRGQVGRRLRRLQGPSLFELGRRAGHVLDSPWVARRCGSRSLRHGQERDPDDEVIQHGIPMRVRLSVGLEEVWVKLEYNTNAPHRSAPREPIRPDESSSGVPGLPPRISIRELEEHSA